MAFDLGEELKKMVLAGIGAVAVTAEKSKEIIEELVKKGEITVAEGKVLNEELMRKVKNKVNDVVNEHVTVTVTKSEEPTAEVILTNLDKMSKEDLDAIKAKLAELEKERAKKTKKEA